MGHTTGFTNGSVSNNDTFNSLVGIRGRGYTPAFYWIKNREGAGIINEFALLKKRVPI